MQHRIIAGLSFVILMTAAVAQPAVATEVFYDGDDYFLTANAGNWLQAEQQAETDGGHLASIHSAAENQFLVDAFLSVANDRSVLWVGLYDPIGDDGSGTAHATDFVWSDGTPLDYTNWNTGTGEPNNYQNEEYWAAINWHYAASGTGPIGTWNDLPLNGSDSYSATANGPYLGIVEVAAPEPSGVGLLGVGLLGAGVVRRRRKAA